VSALQDQMDAAFAEALGHFRAGRLGEAETVGDQILAVQPRLAETLHLMGAVALKRGQPDAAIGWIERALAFDGRVATYHNTLGEAYRLKGDAGQALACYERALAIDPGLAHARGNIAQLLSLGGGKLVLDYYRRQLDAAPDNAVATAELAGALARSGDAEAAVALYRQALALNPGLQSAYCNMGLVLADLGRIDEAIGCYLTALALRPDSADAHNNLGLALLLKGDYAAAWPHHEYRAQPWTNRFRMPAWKGEDLAGGRILLHAEQGFGDTLQFVRYTPLVAARGGRVVLEVQPALKRLLGRVAGVEAVVTRDVQTPDIAWHCPLMSLPLAFGTTLQSIPAAMPYIAPPVELLAPWRRRIGSAPGLKLGLAWQGQPGHRRDRDRSLPPAALASLAAVAGVSYFALQKTVAGGTGFPDLPPALRRDGLTTDLAPDFGDYADTAAAIAALDLVVTVDTSIAHLAGALGKPVWVLLHRVPDWRWGGAGPDTPWYPSARLFRQHEAGDWEPVVKDVARALAAITA
jgi:Flp pilus assembly protein TadD